MQAMTPIKDVFMLSIDAQLDYETLRKICLTGHSRIPVYEEVEIPVPKFVAGMNVAGIDIDDATASRLSLDGRQPHMQKVKKIIGILLVKQCVLLDPNGARFLPISPRTPESLKTDFRRPQMRPPCGRSPSTRFRLFRTTSPF